MTDDEDRPDNVIPFPHVSPYALSRALRQYFQSLADEPLPPEIESLAQEFVKLAEGPAAPKKPTKGAAKTKDTKEKV
jgi:hypothetical protein